MLDSTSRLREPLLSARQCGSHQTRTGLRVQRAAANRPNRYVTVTADHLGTPTAANEIVLAWLRELR